MLQSHTCYVKIVTQPDGQSTVQRKSLARYITDQAGVRHVIHRCMIHVAAAASATVYYGAVTGLQSTDALTEAYVQNLITQGVLAGQALPQSGTLDLSVQAATGQFVLAALPASSTAEADKVDSLGRRMAFEQANSGINAKAAGSFRLYGEYARQTAPFAVSVHGTPDMNVYIGAVPQDRIGYTDTFSDVTQDMIESAKSAGLMVFANIASGQSAEVAASQSDWVFLELPAGCTCTASLSYPLGGTSQLTYRTIGGCRVYGFQAPVSGTYSVTVQ